MGEERREFQRLRLDPPIPGKFGGVDALILEIGVLGARIQHQAELPAQYEELHFDANGDEVVLRCDVVRTVTHERAKYPGTGMESGLKFLAAVGDSGDRLRTLLSTLVVNAIDNRAESSATRLHRRQIDGDRTVRGADAQFLCFRFENSGWARRRVFLPEQPSNGFTVARGEDDDEMQSLCAVYEASDEEGRRLIRLFAELSISDALQIPPKS
jgi:hypothetical protein